MTKKDNAVKKKKTVKKEVKEEIKKEEVVEEKATLKSILELVGILLFIVIVLVFFPNTVVWNIVVLLLILTVLVFVHEFGHFIVAKKCGVYVHEFALGMGPLVLSFKRKNDPTMYSLRALPIGGYCQMAGEEGEDDEKLEKDQFMCNKSKIQRTLILVAGVTMNFITAIILLFFIAFIWGSTDQSSFIGVVSENSPASDAGIVVGDKIVEVNGKSVSTWDKLSLVTSLKNKNDYYEYVIEHADGSRDTYKITPAEYVTIDDKTIRITDNYTLEDILKEYGKTEDEVTVSKLIGIGSSSKRYYGFTNAIKYAFTKFGSIVSLMIQIVCALITGNLGLSALSGPVGMYTLVGTTAKAGIANLIYLAAYLSINLGVLNILPFPAFDGGRVLFVLIEAITRKKVNPNVEAMFHTIGFMLLMLLMLYITYQDIVRLLF